LADFGVWLGRYANFIVELFRESQAAGKSRGEKTRIQFEEQARLAAKHLKKYVEEIWLRREAEPLRLVLMLMGAIADQLGDLRIDPCKGIGEGHGPLDADLFAFTDSEHSGAAISALVTSKNQCAIERRGVKRAGSVAKMMIEMEDRNAGVSGKQTEDSQVVQVAGEFAQCLAFIVGTGNRGSGEKSCTENGAARPRMPRLAGDSDGVEITPSNSGVLQAKTNCRPRNPGCDANALEFRFFDGG